MPFPVSLRVSPVPGRRVRDNRTGEVVDSTRDVPNDRYWRRKIADGDLAPVSEEPTRRSRRGEEATA